MNLEEMLREVRNLEDGDYAECGVYQGNSAITIYQLMNRNAQLWLFDSFAGHEQPSEFDNAVCHPKGRYSDTSVELVRKKIPPALIIVGFIPASLKIADSKTFRFVHIDLDHYWPTKGACEFFKNRMVSGGIIRFDDYTTSDCPGATKAIDEVFGQEVLLGDARWVSSSKS